MRLHVFLFMVLTAVFCSKSIAADEGNVYGPVLEGFEYPLPVLRFRFESQR